VKNGEILGWGNPLKTGIPSLNSWLKSTNLIKIKKE
jgi:hypothetical protein